MSIKRTFKNADKLFPWSLTGVILALLFGIITLYSEFIRENKAVIGIEVFSNISVIDLKEDLEDLEILFKGNDIKKSKDELRIITLRLSNTGNKDILKVHYDDNDPPGIHILKGRLIDANLIEWSNEYLKKNLKLIKGSPNRVPFSKVIIEPRDSFVIKLLVLSPANESSQIEWVGKIAGVKNIVIKEIYKERGKESFLKRTFAGTLMSQMARSIAYSAFIVILFAIVGSGATYISVKLEKRGRKKLVIDFKRITDLSLTEKDEYIFKTFIENGKGYLDSILKIVTDKEYLESLLQQENKGPAKYYGFVPFPIEQLMQPHIARELIGVGFLRNIENDFEIDKHLFEVLSIFLDFVIKSED